jgi:calcineurin-like phosphoesterase family protein
MKIFVISDTHFNHENIKKYENRPDDFNKQIVFNWTNAVNAEDLVIHLGDVIFGQEKEKHLANFLKVLPGKKVLTRGNHDPKDWDWYMNLGFDFVCDYFVYNDLVFSHVPLTPLPRQARLNIHGHFHRGLHRGPDVIRDDFYNYDYYKANTEKFALIQIEDELRPFTLEEVLLKHWKS